MRLFFIYRIQIYTCFVRFLRCILTSEQQMLCTNTANVIITVHTVTRLPSNRRPTSSECVYLVTYGMSGHVTKMAVTRYAIRSAIHANFMASCSVEPELLPIEVLHCRNGDFFYLFAPVTLTLTWWPSYTWVDAEWSSDGEGCPLPSRLLGLGERRKLPQPVWGGAPAENGFWRIFKATERSFLYPYDKI